MKKKKSNPLFSILVIAFFLYSCGNSASEKNDEQVNIPETQNIHIEVEQPTEKSAEELLEEMMDDGMIQETDAKQIESAIREIEEYNWWEGHGLGQSSINKEWSAYCANNEYNTYTKSYELSAHDDLEIQFAYFKTYDFDYDYLLFCASLFDTSLIDSEEVQLWMQEFDIEDEEAEKTFGDATFTMRYHEYDDGECYVELAVWACGDINAN